MTPVLKFGPVRVISAKRRQNYIRFCHWSEISQRRTNGRRRRDLIAKGANVRMEF